jgi:predicted AAA+ superfamily ATPase
MELVRKLASQTAQILALENAASASALNISTVRDYLQLLQDVFMIEELPAWGKTLSSRSSAKPKIHFTDSGLAARLLGLTAEKMSRRDPSSLTEFGHLLETFAVSELLKEISWLDDTCLTGHWRTHDGKEVDFIIELMDGSIYGFEIKSGERIPASDFGGLAALRKYAGASFKGGFVFHLGLRAYRFDDRLYALPLSLLWEA